MLIITIFVSYEILRSFYIGKHIYDEKLTIYVDEGQGFEEKTIDQGTLFKDIIENKNTYIYGEYEPLYNGEYIDLSINTTNRISINKASAEELTLLPGIGIKTANKIIEYREKRDGFYYLEEIKNVKGIGDSKFEKLKEFICL